MNSKVQVLTVAGNDCDGSAGMPADLHAFFISGVYGMGILTAAVAGNSYEISDQVLMPTEFIDHQFAALKKDFKIAATKTGMLGTSAVIRCFHRNFAPESFGKLVVDPVIITKHGNFLLDNEAYDDFVKLIIPMADVITPNAFEAQALSGVEIESRESMMTSAKRLQELGAKNVIVKGKHENPTQEKVEDLVLKADGSYQWLSMPYVSTERLNGTGDVFSAVITAEIAKGNDLFTAAEIAKNVVYDSISKPIIVGHRHGPINLWNAYSK